MTFRTSCFTPIAVQHDAILYLILVLAHHLKESINANLLADITSFLGWKTMPKHVFFLSRQFEVRLEDRKIVFCRAPAKLFFPNAHLVAMPTLHTSIIHTKRGIGYNKAFFDTDNLTEPLARGTRTKRRVKGEHIV